MSWIVVNGSSQCQTGPTNADRNANSTQPYTHKNSVVTSPALVPPAIPWATTQIQPIRPMARSSQAPRAAKTINATTIGMRTSVEDVDVPVPPDGDGDGEGDGDAGEATDGDALEATVADGATDGGGVGAMTVKVVVPRAMSPSSVDFVVHRTE